MRTFLAFLLSAACLAAASPLSNRHAPGFALMDSGFKHFYDPQDYRGKILVIDFMLTSCPHCQKVAGVLEEIATRYRDRVQVLEIVMPPDNQASVAKYIAAQKITVPVLFDCGQVTASYLKATPQNPHIEVPHIFIVNAQGWIQSDYAYSPATQHIFEGRGLAQELDRMLAAAGKR